MIVNHDFPQAQRGGGLGFVRGFSNPNVTGFGWMSPGDLLDDTAHTKGGQGIAACPVIPKPQLGALLNPTSGYNGIVGANGGCSGVFDHYPAYNDLVADANGVMVPNGPRVAARPLKKGDWYDYSDNAERMFQQPHTHIGMENMQRFVEGRCWFHTSMQTGEHNESSNDRNDAAVGFQGPFFNQTTRFCCHANNGVTRRQGSSTSGWTAWQCVWRRPMPTAASCRTRSTARQCR